MGDGRIIRYVVAAPRVRVGDIVEQDCIIGATLPLSKGYPILVESSAGWALFEGLEGEDAFDLLTPLSLEPNDIFCRAEPSPQCSNIRNPDFQTSEWWELGGFGSEPATIALGGGLVLGTMGWAQQRDIVLDSETEYAVIVRHVPSPGASAYSFIVSVGGTDHIVNWAPDDGYVPQDTVIDSQTYEPQVADGLYTLMLSGLHNSTSALIDFVCIFDPNADLPQPPGGCILFNHEFDQQDHWTKNAPGGGGPVPAFQSGLAFIIDEASISQSLRLSPKDDGPQGYILSVYARRAGTNTGAENIDLDWEWGTYGGCLLYTSDAADE